MDAELAELTAAAATTLVQRLALDGWEAARSVVVALWRRSRPRHAEMIGEELDGARAEVLAARQAGDVQGEEELAAEWRGRLRRLAAGDPQAVAGLRELVRSWADTAPGAGASGAGQASIRVRATGRSRVIAAGRDAHVTGR